MREDSQGSYDDEERKDPDDQAIDNRGDNDLLSEL